MKRFRYFRDGLFLLGCSLYAANRWIIKPRIHNVFLQDYFNDLLLIPCAIPPLLWIQRRLGLRKHDQAPSAAEIALYLVVWSMLFEVFGPCITPRTTGDPWDVVAYFAGGILATLWWHRQQSLRPALDP